MQALKSMLFDGWQPLVHVLAVGVPGYVGLIVLLRITGKRTLTKMNAFDFVVTVALGSTLATMLLSGKVSLAAGLSAFALLIFLQFAVTFAAVRSPRVRSLVKAEPTLLLHRGEFLHVAMRRERVSRDEVIAAARKAGIADLADVAAVVLETDGEMSVIGMAEMRADGSGMDRATLPENRR